jgi:hypothetical protein
MDGRILELHLTAISNMTKQSLSKPDNSRPDPIGPLDDTHLELDFTAIDNVGKINVRQKLIIQDLTPLF